jgi:GH25 family lysozyme M1 (1,4-beta-N-acetylmuramidase)
MDVGAFRKLGMDVSTWNGNMNFKKAKENGIEFAMLRSSFGKEYKQIDNQFYENVRKAKEAQIPIGAYHYLYATTVENALREADVCKRTIGDIKLEYPVAIDVEDSKLSFLSKQNLTTIVDAFCNSMERSGFYVSIYFNCDFRKNYLDIGRLARYQHWLAWYGNNNGNVPCGTCEKEAGMWQYTDQGNGRKYGSDSDYIDLNICYKDYETIIKTNHNNNW